jgi:hypothetical protein
MGVGRIERKNPVVDFLVSSLVYLFRSTKRTKLVGHLKLKYVCKEGFAKIDRKTREKLGYTFLICQYLNGTEFLRDKNRDWIMYPSHFYSGFLSVNKVQRKNLSIARTLVERNCKII